MPRSEASNVTPSRPTQLYGGLLDAELQRVERGAQQLSAWILVGTVGALNVVAHLYRDRPLSSFLVFTLIFSLILVIWFAGIAVLIRRGNYRPYYKYVNLVLQVSTVTLFLVSTARLAGVEFALTSIAPLLYLLVIGLTSMNLNPRLSLLAGALAAAQFVGAYALWLQDDAGRLVNEYNSLSWTDTILKTSVILMMGVAAMIIARRSRELLERVVAQVHYEEQLKYINQEMALAAEVQQRLVPDAAIESRYYEVETEYRPAKRVSGDYLDWIERPDGSCVALIADVAGKGYPAALLMANIQAISRLLLERGRPLDELAVTLNNAIFRASVQGRFVSLVAMEFDPRQNRVRYCNCGHNPPFILSADAQLRELRSTGPVLGIDADYQPGFEQARFAAGDVLLAFTDGLSELRDAQGRQLGVDSIQAGVQQARPAGAGALKSLLVRQIDEFLAGETAADDLTFLCLRSR